MSDPPRYSVLFLTNSEHGQANVVLATAYEFLTRNEFNVHIASYEPLEPRISWLNREIDSLQVKSGGDVSQWPTATFHKMGGVSMADNIKNNNLAWPHRTGISNCVQSYKDMAKIVLREDIHNYLSAYDSCLAIIKNVKPRVVVVDQICLPGVDACKASGVEFIMLYPMSFYEICTADQPKAQILWKYPVVSSGHPFPVPLLLIPANVYLFIQLILKFILGNVAANLNRARSAHGITTPLPLGPIADRIHLCPSLPEIDFTYDIIPDTAIGCGPILLPAKPISETDPELGKWLARHSTILINLGSHLSADHSAALEMARSLVDVLNLNPDLQVLWKLKYDWESDPEFKGIVLSALGSDRLRISSWLLPETVSFLTSGNVVVFVHHGGANSYYEACYAGVPQIVLPVWYDTFHYAAKVEFLGLGLHGNKGSEPGVSNAGLTKALTTVLTDSVMKEKAKAIGELCRKTVGREVACDQITNLARGGRQV